jgi:hypothetical protein
LYYAAGVRNDLCHLQARQVLAVAHALAAACLVLVLEDADLVAAQVLDDLGDDLRSVHQRGADLRFAVAAQQQYVEIDLGADVYMQQVDVERLVGLNPVLSTAAADYRVNGNPPVSA